MNPSLFDFSQINSYVGLLWDVEDQDQERDQVEWLHAWECEVVEDGAGDAPYWSMEVQW